MVPQRHVRAQFYSGPNLCFVAAERTVVTPYLTRIHKDGAVNFFRKGRQCAGAAHGEEKRCPIFEGSGRDVFTGFGACRVAAKRVGVEVLGGAADLERFLPVLHIGISQSACQPQIQGVVLLRAEWQGEKFLIFGAVFG